MKNPPELEDPDMKKLMVLWDRMERSFWRRVSWIMIGLAFGVAISAIIVIFLTSYWLFLEVH